MAKVRVNITIDREVIEWLRSHGINNRSEFIESAAREKIRSMESEKTGIVPVSKDFLDWLSTADLYGGAY